MAIKKVGPKSHAKLTDELLCRRAGLVSSRQRRSELENRVRGYEERYGIKSRSVHVAIDRGQLKETHEVCRWLMDYDLLKRTKAC